LLLYALLSYFSTSSWHVFAQQMTESPQLPVRLYHDSARVI
jgi:hypothetical protein